MATKKKEKVIELKAITKCPTCGKVECEETETLFECEHIEIVRCVCVNCNIEFVNYKLKCSISNMLSEMCKH